MKKIEDKSRRHFLRGAGVALALPWMESLPLFAQATNLLCPLFQQTLLHV